MRGEPLGGVRIQPVFVPEPRRVGEVVQAHDRFHSPFVTGIEDPHVTVERGVVDLAFRRLEPCPLDREPERVAPHAGGAVQSVLGTEPEVARVTGGLDPATGLPARPVVRRLARSVVSAFHLEPGGRDTEEEVGGKCHGLPRDAHRRAQSLAAA